MKTLIVLIDVLPLLAFAYLSIVQGRIDAILYSRRGDLAFSGNEHRSLVKTRTFWFVISLCMAAAVLCYTYLMPGDFRKVLYATIVELIALGIFGLGAYSFFHNGAYMINKNLIGWKALDEPDIALKIKWFKSSSPLDSAKMSYGFHSRLYLFLFAIALVTAAIFLQLKILSL